MVKIGPMSSIGPQNNAHDTHDIDIDLARVNFKLKSGIGFKPGKLSNIYTVYTL